MELPQKHFVDFIDQRRRNGETDLFSTIFSDNDVLFVDVKDTLYFPKDRRLKQRQLRRCLAYSSIFGLPSLLFLTGYRVSIGTEPCVKMFARPV